jgi:WD40 repeat protein
MRYRAFFSYARADDRIANWLHRQLDSYRTPKPLIGAQGALGPVPAKLHPIFRDRTDLEAGGHVDANLQEALANSESLIVLCTPTSAKSKWVNQECETFLKLGREAHIFPVIGAGDPESNDPNTECFPPALRGRGLLAADLREIKKPNGQLLGDGRDGGRLKLIAGLLGVPLDQLVQRERRRQRTLVAGLSGAALVFAGVAAAAGAFWWVSEQRASTIAQQTVEIAAERDEANRQRDEAKLQRDEATKQRGIADSKTVEAIANAEEAERQEGIATANAKQARDTLHRFFATQAWDRHGAGDYLEAARYALAGMRVSPENGHLYHAALAGAMHRAGEPLPLLWHGDPTTGMAYSHDGKEIAAGDLASVKIWTVGTGQIRQSLRGASQINHFAFASLQERVITAHKDGIVQVWNSRTGELLQTLAAHGKAATKVLISRNGALVATLGEDMTAKLWRVQNGVLVLAWSTGGSHSRDPLVRMNGTINTQLLRNGVPLNNFTEVGNLTNAAFSWDGSKLMTTAQIPIVWSVATGEELYRLAGHEKLRYVRGGEFSRNGRFIVTYGDDHSAIVWDANDGRRLFSLPHQDEVTSAKFGLLDERIITTSRDKTAKLWDALNGKLIAVFADHQKSVLDADFSKDHQRVATTGEDGFVKIWRPDTGQFIATLGKGNSTISKVEFSPSGEDIAIPSRGAQIWRAPRTGARLAPTLLPEARAAGAAFSPDNQTIYTVGWGEQSHQGILTWSAKTGSRRADFWKHKNFLEDVRISPDGKIVAVATFSAALLFDAASGRELHRLELQSARLKSIAFSRDGKRLVTSGGEGATKVWDVSSGQLIAELEGHAHEVIDASFSPNGALIATAGLGAVKLWDAAGGPARFTFEQWKLLPTAAAFHPNGRWLATSGDQSVSVWDVKTGTRTQRLPIDASGSRSLIYSPDGSRLITSDDDAITIWDSADGQLIESLRGHKNNVHRITMSSDGTKIISVSKWDAAIIWDISRLIQPWPELARDACNNLLGPTARRFPQGAVETNPLLRAEWRDARRDVCEGIPGVKSIDDLRSLAGLPPEQPAQP